MCRTARMAGHIGPALDVTRGGLAHWLGWYQNSDEQRIG